MSWLEAMRLIALTNPSLFRKIHRFALSLFDEASRVARATAGPHRIPNPEDFQDHELVVLLDRDDFRQLLHITYGYLLNAKNEAGNSLFRDQIYHILTQFEEDYWSLLEENIEKHLSGLGVGKKEPTQKIEKRIEK
jgi:hypothetical protein